MSRNAPAAAAAVTIASLALFAGAAAAGGPGNGGGSGNGQGNGQAKGQSQAAAQTGSTSATAHGHASSHPRASATKAGSTTVTAHGHASSHPRASATKAASTTVTVHGRASVHSRAAAKHTTSSVAAQGVKPSSTTDHDTHATAGSNQTKLYGNGKTAGQIAMQNGASATTMLHGPGNSQPHKVAVCPKGHEVDVHALKSHSGSCARTQTAPSVQAKAKEHGKSAEHAQANAQGVSAQGHVTICHATGSATNPFVVISPSASGVFHGHLDHQDRRDIVPTFQFNGQTYSQNWTTSGQALFNAGCAPTSAAAVTAQQAAPPANAAMPAAVAVVAQAPQAAPAVVAAAPAAKPTTPAAAPASRVGVKGAAHAVRSPKPSAGVKAASANAPARGQGVAGQTLPFTGLPLWIALVAAAALIGVGGLVRLGARTTR